MNAENEQEKWKLEIIVNVNASFIVKLQTQLAFLYVEFFIDFPRFNRIKASDDADIFFLFLNFFLLCFMNISSTKTVSQQLNHFDWVINNFYIIWLPIVAWHRIDYVEVWYELCCLYVWISNSRFSSIANHRISQHRVNGILSDSTFLEISTLLNSWQKRIISDSFFLFTKCQLRSFSFRVTILLTLFLNMFINIL